MKARRYLLTIMQISLPKDPTVKKIDANHAIFEIENCYPGYGVTLGNAFRRVLLSSLPGVAVVGVKISGVQHEFSTLPHMAEDVIEIIMNLKQVRFKMIGEERVKLELKIKGKKDVTAGDIKTPAGVEVVNKDQHIASLTNAKAQLDAEIEIERGLGFVPVEQQQKEKQEIGHIAIDALFAPIKKVNVDVENMRVGDRTDYNRLIVDVETDGSIEPEEAFKQAAGILLEQFGVFGKVEEAVSEKKDEKKAGKKKAKKTEDDSAKKNIDEIKGFSTRTVNALQGAGVKTLAGLAKKKASFLKEIEGLGGKGIKEIEKVLKKAGFEIKE